jgi:SAM-dependent methyltransferase
MNEMMGRMKQNAHAMWSSGDYSMIGVAFLLVSEQLCETIELHAGQKVLDVATGTGNTALAAARRYGEVTGIDFVAAWLERAQERALAEKLPVFLSYAHADEINKRYLGPMVKLYPALDEDKKAQFDRDMESLYRTFNRSGDESLLLPSEYLEAVITKH